MSDKEFIAKMLPRRKLDFAELFGIQSDAGDETNLEIIIGGNLSSTEMKKTSDYCTMGASWTDISFCDGEEAGDLEVRDIARRADRRIPKPLLNLNCSVSPFKDMGSNTPARSPVPLFTDKYGVSASFSPLSRASPATREAGLTLLGMGTSLDGAGSDDESVCSAPSFAPIAPVPVKFTKTLPGKNDSFITNTDFCPLLPSMGKKMKFGSGIGNLGSTKGFSLPTKGSKTMIGGRSATSKRKPVEPKPNQVNPKQAASNVKNVNNDKEDKAAACPVVFVKKEKLDADVQEEKKQQTMPAYMKVTRNSTWGPPRTRSARKAVKKVPVDLGFEPPKPSSRKSRSVRAKVSAKPFTMSRRSMSKSLSSGKRKRVVL